MAVAVSISHSLTQVMSLFDLIGRRDEYLCLSLIKMINLNDKAGSEGRGN